GERLVQQRFGQAQRVHAPPLTVLCRSTSSAPGSTPAACADWSSASSTPAWLNRDSRWLDCTPNACLACPSSALMLACGWYPISLSCPLKVTVTVSSRPPSMAFSFTNLVNHRFSASDDRTGARLCTRRILGRR